MVSTDIQNGRKRIYTDVDEITADNVIDVLRKAYGQHMINARDCDLLNKFEKGEQPLTRVKTYRPDIDIQVVDNVVSQIQDYWRSLKWGNPITLVQNGDLDDKSKAIQRLNDMCYNDGSFSVKQEIGDWVEMTGICNEFIGLVDDWEEGKPFHYTVSLDPRTSFCVYSSWHPDKRKMMGVTYRKDSIGNIHFTCITKKWIFDVVNLLYIANGEQAEEEKWYHSNGSGIKNRFGKINIIEWNRDIDRTGVWERQIDNVNSLNILESDFINQVDQNTQSIWLGIDIDLGKDENGNDRVVKSGDFIWAKSTENGKPSLHPQSIPYDYAGVQNNIINKRANILEMCNVPARNDNSGGSTGVATNAATGNATSEMVAEMLANLQKRSYQEEIEVILSVIKKSPHIKKDDEILNLIPSDVKVSIGRLKSHEISTKINAICTGIAHGIDGESLINEFNVFTDPNEVWLKSKDGIKAYQDSIFNKNNDADGADGEKAVNSDRLDQDMSDQVTQSPNIDGTQTGGVAND